MENKQAESDRQAEREEYEARWRKRQMEEQRAEIEFQKEQLELQAELETAKAISNIYRTNSQESLSASDVSSEVVAKAIIRKAEEIQQQRRDTQADPTAKYKPLPKSDYVHKWSSSLVNKETAPSPKYGEQGVCVQNEVVDNVCSKEAEVELTVPTTKQEPSEQCKPNCQQYTPLSEAYGPPSDQYRGSCEQPRPASEQKQYKFNENVAGRTEQLLEHQTSLTKQLINHQVKTMLPQTKIPIYAGDPLDYANFMRSFEFGVEEKTEDPHDRLYHLVQHTTGQAQGLVKSCFHLPTEQSILKPKNC